MSTQPETHLHHYRDELRSLEDEFAGAMTQLYSVGNHLARVRSQLDRAAAPQQAGEGAAPPVPQTPPTQPTAAPQRPAPVPVTPHQTAVPAPPQAPRGPLPAGAAPRPGPVPAYAVPAAAQHHPQPASGPIPPHQPPPVPFVEREPWWQREGIVAKVLATVGAGVTLIGVAFLLALAIQAGYFGPLARVISGGLLAVVLVGAAFVVRARQETPVGALGLAATGFATAYLDILAVTRIYEWVPAAAGLVLAGLVAGGGLVLARVWGSQLLGVIIVLGVAMLAPFVGGDRVLLVGAFLLVLTIASYPAQIGRRWFVLDVARVLPTTLYAVIAVAAQDDGHEGTLMAVVLAVFVLATTVAGLRLSLPRSINVLTLVATGPAVLAGIAEDKWVGAAVLVALMIAHILAAVITPVEGIDIQYRLREVSLVVAAATGVLAAAKVLDSAYLPLAITVIAISWVAVGAATRSWSVLAVAAPLSGLALLLSLRLVPLVLLRGEADQTELRHLVEAAAVVVLLALVGLAVRRLDDRQGLPSGILLGAAVVLAPVGLVLAGSLVGSEVASAEGGFITGHALASVLWMALAAVLLVRGLGRDDDAGVAVRLGLALAAFVVAKLLFFDLSALDGIARVLSFIVAGILLLLMGVGYAQALERSRRRRSAPVDNSPAPPPDLPNVG